MPEPLCPVCDTELSEGPIACPKCGFPTSLRAEAVETLRHKDPFVRPGAPGPSPARRSAPRPPPARAPGELDALADELDRTAVLLVRMGSNDPGIAVELRRAALVQLEGRPDEALRGLQAANSHARELLHSLLDRRIHDLDARQASLTKDGLGRVVEGPVARLKTAVQEGRFPEAVELLSEAEAILDRAAEELESLRIPIREVEELLALLDGAGLDLPEERKRALALLEAVANPSGTKNELARIVERAEELRAALREKVPKLLQQELDEHEGTLRPYPDDHAAAAGARAAHARALSHLEGGRLADAVGELRTLRGTIEALGPVPLPRVEHQVAEPEPEPPARSVSVPELVQTARRLATRVRALDPASELAYEAAAQIRQATELLRARRLDEAAETLNQLMRTLDQSGAVPERSVPS
ncbi:MAG TPA: hypothetical protein VGX00_01240 [Thermoplasmata archaeon]|nr:hypothetical protein [Thermoplasmata archaeon]